jgi:hypothetical protein
MIKTASPTQRDRSLLIERQLATAAGKSFKLMQAKDPKFYWTDGSTPDSAEATKFLLSNRQQIVDMKRQYKDAVLGNNMAQAARIEQEYKTRFGIGMTVKPDEWDSAIKLREVSVSERMVDAMPADVRGAFQQSLGGPMAQAMGLPDGGLYMGDSAKQRNAIRQFSSGLSNPSSDEGS